MAEQNDQATGRKEGIESEKQEITKERNTGAVRRWFTKGRLATLLIAALVLQGVGLACYKAGRGHSNVTPSAEIELGEYRFVADRGEDGPIKGAGFQLHIALLEQVDKAARGRLEERRHRVRQDVEQLLRQAHGGDFDDPLLGELKRQLQEQINETLDMRAIADVIITDLQLEASGRGPATVAETAESVPWVEKGDVKTKSGKLKAES